MVDTFTTTKANSLGDLAQTAFDRYIYHALRAQPIYDAMYDVRPALQPIPSSTVTFSFYNELAAATTSLDQSTDVDAVGMGETQVSVSLSEYGNAVRLTAMLRATSFADVDEGALNNLAWNIRDTIDTLARDPLTAGTNVIYPGAVAARGDLVAGSTITSNDVREAVSLLRARSSEPKMHGFYYATIHPHVSYDLRSEAGSSATWRDSHIYASPETIFAGETGAYEGAAFIENPRARIFTDGGSGNVDAYATVFCGQQAGAKAVAIEPHLVQSPITDKLRRLAPWGWYVLAGWGRFREASIQRLESASALGTN